MSNSGSEPAVQHPPFAGAYAPSAALTFPTDWLHDGLAALDLSRGVAELNPALATWLGFGALASVDIQQFWDRFWSVAPDWKPPVSAALASPKVFSALELSLGDIPARQWFTLNLVRQASVHFLGLNSICPPLTELEEEGSAALLQSETARRQILVRLLRAEGGLNSLVRRFPGVIFSQRTDLSFQFVSTRIEELTGVPVHDWQRLPQRFWEVVHEGDLSDLQAQLKHSAQSDGQVSSVFRLRHTKTGRVSYVLEHREAVRTHSGLLLGYDGVWLDVTRQVIAEKRLSTAAWKETLSVLTMGLAHDFNNIMAGIHALSENFQVQLGPGHSCQEGLALIQRNSLQASQLIQRILQLHHGKVGERTYLNLNDLVSEIVELVRKIAPRRIRIESVLASESLPIYADAVEFRQVLINLALNSVDAMRQGGRLLFEVSRYESFPALGHVQGVLPHLPSACVAVEDDGCGIPGHHLASIFDPFFTTKSLEKGSGLGLYNARLFAEKHHGAISVDSSLNKGTLMRLWLPQADFTEGERSEPQLPTRRRTFLVFGPAGDALDRSAEFLRTNGFAILTASDFQEAAALVNSRDYSLSGVLLLATNEPSSAQLAAACGRFESIKLIVQATGCNQDELDAGLLSSADLLLPRDLTRAEMLARIHALFTDDLSQPS